MAETFTLNKKAVVAPHTLGTAAVTIADSIGQSAGAQRRAASLHTPFLCQRPDGSQIYCVLDTSRWTPNGPIFVLPIS
jgi:hypothetical protein